MPAYNAAPYLEEALQSMLRQTYKNWELLVCDDCSADESRALLDAYAAKDARIIPQHNAQNMGYQASCNKLFALCKGDFITFLDADDFCPAERLSLQLKAFEERPSLGMVGTAYHIVDMSGRLIDEVVKPCSREEIRAELPKNSPFCGATLMIRREVYEKIGGYRPFFKDYAYQDYDWAYCIADEFESINLPQPLYSYRQNPLSNSKKVSARRFVSDKIVQYLGKQRAERGADDLQRGDLEALNLYIKGLLAPFEADPALIYRKYAEGFMYNRLYRRAIATAWQAVRAAPSKLVNYRTWLYCVRVGLWRSLFGGK